MADTNLQQFVINIGTKAQIEAGIESGTITQDMLSISTDEDIYAKKDEIPTKISDLTNDSDFQTSTQVNSSISAHNTSDTAHSDIREMIDEIKMFKFPNAIIVGSPTINNGQVSGFSNSNYLIFPFLFDVGERAFELNFHFMTGNDVTTPQNFIGSSYCMASYISNGKFYVRVSGNGTSWNVLDLETSLSVQANSVYYIIIEFNRLNYTIYASTDGETYNQIGYKVTTEKPIAGQLYIGVGNNMNNPFLGIINLNKWYLKLNNSIVWDGMDDAGLATRADISLSNLDAAGEQRFADKQDKLVSGTNIKTIGGESLLGSGDITVSADTSNCVHKTGEEYIAGIKHFTDTILVEDTNKFLGSGLANNGSVVLQSSKTDGGFIQFLVQNYPDEESKLYNNGHLCIDKAPSETTTTSTQIDTVGARNTALNNKIQEVSVLPAEPVDGVLYVIPE